ncbi:transmembrane protein [Bradyrhizobium lupini HPC(L)]|uniref:Transmembrane protein n=1 Tax=Bradyrhizobium lupini HPC(L) TaxID=1229491 RepID=A0ABP2RQW7_RHILU|nr:transmembrane protein [Bradyrhizobium lupini HPC(L)]
MEPLILTWLLKLLQGSPIGETVRSAEYVYPVLEATHILGIALLVGPAFTFDLRLLGVGRRVVSVTTAARYLLRVSHIGFAIAVTTGIALLSAQATVVAGTGAAPWKFGLLVLACLNVLVFHCGIYRRVDGWNDARTAPLPARLGAAVSLIAWTGVIFAGRLLAYT